MMTNAKPIDAVAHGIRWRKLNRPKRWQPKKPGTELVGHYLGQTLMDGKFGQYSVAMIAVPLGEGFSQPYTVSGTAVITSIDGSGLEEGQLLRLVYQGIKELSNGRKMKMFDVYAGEAILDETTALMLAAKMEEQEAETKAEAKVRRCGHCREPGHYRTRCPNKDS